MGRRVKKWNITGEVVPPGTLAPNPHNPYGRLTEQERWDRIVTVCADVMVRVWRDRQKARDSQGTTTEAGETVAQRGGAV